MSPTGMFPKSEKTSNVEILNGINTASKVLNGARKMKALMIFLKKGRLC
jgi:hypothetical protein